MHRRIAVLVAATSLVVLAALVFVSGAMAQGAGDAAGNAAGAAMGIGMMIVWGVLGCGSLALWIWALVDCIQRTFPGDNDKLIWILVIVLLGGLGAIIYLIVGRQKGTKP